ncbi:MAG: M23 family metallopeptidase [Candidatus Paceibacterota bacterium]
MKDKTKNIYYLPCDKKELIKALSDPIAHKNRFIHAIDFTLPEGSKIYAAQDGEIGRIKDDSNEGGFTKKYREADPNKYLNYITIKHKNGEFSEYAHLKYNSLKIKIGDKVRRGDLIALSGNTGISTEPHLHFHVLRTIDDGNDWKTLDIKWGNTPKIEEKEIRDGRIVKYYEF